MSLLLLGNQFYWHYMNNIKKFDDEDIFSWRDSRMNSVVLVRCNYFFWSCPLIIDQIVFKVSVLDDPGTNSTNKYQSVTHNSNKMENGNVFLFESDSNICIARMVLNVPRYSNNEWQIYRNIHLTKLSIHCPKFEYRFWTIDKVGLDCISIFHNNANYRYM